MPDTLEEPYDMITGSSFADFDMLDMFTLQAIL